MVSYSTGSLKQCSPARAQAMAAAKRPSKAGFGTRLECKKWALATSYSQRGASTWLEPRNLSPLVSR